MGNSKYAVVAGYIRDKISKGEYAVGGRIESENELVKFFGYSRQTIRQAFAQLEAEGFLTRRRGSGTYVSGSLSSRAEEKNIGVITTYITDYIFPGITRGIEDTLSRNDCRLSLGVTKNRVEEEARILRSFLDGSPIDGLLVEGTKTAFQNPNLPLYQEFAARGIPCVFLNSFYRELSPVYVVTNDRECGAQAARLLWERFPGGKLGGIFKADDQQGVERYNGFAEEAFRLGAWLSDQNVVWYDTEQRAELFSNGNAAKLWESLKGCTGILCYNDQVAFDLVALLMEKGVHIPQETAVISFDNSGLSDYSPIKISSFHHPKEALGMAAAKKLLRMAAGEKETGLSMAMKLVRKESF